ncbi:MAG TPA: HAD hydrolase family protein [Polyangiaceae bacterium]|nr:HAD hydrolase family protein [Polyangiaceae bacterium]
MVRLSGPQLRTRAAAVRLVVSDVDGVLTDAGVYYSTEGEALKRFSMRDGMGVGLLRDAGIRTAWMTREESLIVAARAKKLAVDLLWSGLRDKRAALPQLVQQLGIPLGAVAYIGDDVNDLAVLRWVSEAGLAVCPADAVAKVAAAAHFVTSARGGHGAFRELCDLILDNQKEHTP